MNAEAYIFEDRILTDVYERMDSIDMPWAARREVMQAIRLAAKQAREEMEDARKHPAD